MLRHPACLLNTLGEKCLVITITTTGTCLVASVYHKWDTIKIKVPNSTVAFPRLVGLQVLLFDFLLSCGRMALLNSDFSSLWIYKTRNTVISICS